MSTNTCELTNNGIPYDWALAGPSGASYVLYPVRGEHTEEAVKEAKDWLRRSFDVVSVRVSWEKDQPVDESKLRTYSSRLELLQAERHLVYVDQPRGLSAIDGMDGKAARKLFKQPLLIDAYTLSMLRQIYEALNEKNRAKMDSFSWVGAVDVGWKLIK